MLGLRKVLSVFFLFFLFLVLSSSVIYAEDKIRISGFKHPRSRYALLRHDGKPPTPQMKTLPLYLAVVDEKNFGSAGTVSCSVDFATVPHVTELTEGYLVDMFGNLRADIFFVGSMNRYTPDLTETEAIELARFIRAGGVVYLGGDTKNPTDISPYNQLFSALGTEDRYRREKLPAGARKQSSEPQKITSVTDGPFGRAVELRYSTYRKLDRDSLDSIYLSESGDVLVIEEQIGQGLLVSSGSLLHTHDFFVDLDNQRFLKNLFASACNRDIKKGSITPDAASTSVREVPLFMQGVAPYTNSDPYWEGQEYDSGNSQSLGCGSTIAQCGCATTSAAMLLASYGINKSPDGRQTDPAVLNSYFNKDSKCGDGGCISRGYVFGAVRWNGAAQYSKEANDVYASQKIVWNGAGAYDASVVKGDLENGRPVILQQPGHFVVATGVDGETFNINDPFYNRDKLTSYNNSALGVRRFKETNSDFSMIEIFAKAPAQIMVIDPDGKRTGYDGSDAEIHTEILGSSYFFEQSAVDPTGAKNKPGVKAGVYTAIVPTPSDGNYDVRIISPANETYSVAVYFTKKDADTNSELLEGIPNSGTQHLYKFSYNTNLGGHNLVKEVIKLSVKRARVWKRGNGKDEFEIKGNLSASNLVSGTSGNVVVKFANFETTIPRSEFKTYNRMKRGKVMALSNYNSIRSIYVYENGKYKIVGENVNLDNLDFPGNATFKFGVGDVEATSGLSFNKRGRI